MPPPSPLNCRAPSFGALPDPVVENLLGHLFTHAAFVALTQEDNVYTLTMADPAGATWTRCGPLSVCILFAYAELPLCDAGALRACPLALPACVPSQKLR